VENLHSVSPLLYFVDGTESENQPPPPETDEPNARKTSVVTCATGKGLGFKRAENLSICVPFLDKCGGFLSVAQ
jgi:hypothetical protein